MERTKSILKLVFKFYFTFGIPIIGFMAIFGSITSTGKITAVEFYKVLVTSIAITASLSSLTLRLSSCFPDGDKKKTIYLKIGERFLHVTVILVLSLLTKYAETKVLESLFFLKHNFIQGFVESLLDFSIFISLYFGVGYFFYALIVVHHTLFEGNERPYD